jgi:DNA modification methylase
MFPADDVADDPGAQVDKAAELQAKWGTATGQLWQLGDHRLICGDCTDSQVVARVMDGEKAALMVTDPPYGVEYDPKWRQEIAKDNGRWNTSNTTIATGEFVHDNQADWHEAWNLFSGDVAYVWCAPGELSMTVFQSLIACGFEIRMQMIWAKQHFVLGRGHYHIQHEPCWYAVRKGSTAYWVGDRTQTTLWEIRNRAAIGDVTKNEEATGHSTQKPIECMERPIRNHDAPIVYDPFLGSGTTLIACERLGRRCRAVEIEPGYVAVALQRFYDMTGVEPVLLSSNNFATNDG